MFSGIVEEIGRVERAAQTAAGVALTIACERVLGGTRVGDSIAVDGVCLTVAALAGSGFVANIQPVTARLSTLGAKRPGAPANLERSVLVGGRVGGHYVQGHVDGVGRVVAKRGEGAALVVEIAAEPDVLRYIVERGFVAIDGASLTVMTLWRERFAVSLVYHTRQHSTLAGLPIGALVNVEIDVMAKYVERLLGAREPTGVTLETLRRAGFA